MSAWHFLQLIWGVLTLVMVLTLILSFIADYKRIRDASGWGEVSGLVFAIWCVYCVFMILVSFSEIP
jgi:hypothetical protein